MVLVIDASILLAWVFDDESSDMAEAAVDLVVDEGAIAPALLAYEFANGVRSAIRRHRLEETEIDEVVARVGALDIRFAEVQMAVLAGTVAPLALVHNLSTYDASYLYLAQRERLPLATLDDRLRAAATAAGCALFA